MNVADAIALVAELSEHQKFRDDPVVFLERASYHELAADCSARNAFMIQPMLTPDPDRHYLYVHGVCFKIGPIISAKELHV